MVGRKFLQFGLAFLFFITVWMKSTLPSPGQVNDTLSNTERDINPVRQHHNLKPLHDGKLSEINNVNPPVEILSVQDLRSSFLELEEMFPKHITSDHDFHLNVNLSNTIGLVREPIDNRHEQCMSIKYETRSLPSASIVIVFYNEIWSVLLRTVTGILLQSQPHLIKEIILVDDASTLGFLGEPLDTFIRKTPKTRIIRHATRKGLIQTRMTGARAATGDVLIFLDAHIEVSKVWLEPLLDYLKENPRTLATPVVDTISADSFKWLYVKDIFSLSAFTWDMVSLWVTMPDDMKTSRSSEISPLTMYTIMGCAMAVNRKVFMELGAWDEGMPSVWGGENVEIVWRYWLCADGVKIVPCSRVAHLIRGRLPFKITTSPEKNYQRVAELWMGDYLPFYYAAVHNRYQLSEAEKKDLEDRKQLMASLHCRDFRWYFDNVLRDMFNPWRNATLQGQLENAELGSCLSVGPEGLIETTHCNQFNRRMYFRYTYDKRIFHNSSHCLMPRNDDGPLRMASCTSTATEQEQWNMTQDVLPEVRGMASSRPSWVRNKYALVRIESNKSGVRKCITGTKTSQGTIVAQPAQCEPNKLHAHWYITYDMDFSI